MKTHKIILVPLFAALLLGNVTAGTILSDSFDSGLTNWTPQSGTWSILPNNTLFGAWSFSNAYSSQGVLKLNDAYQPTGDFAASLDFTRVSNAGYRAGADPLFSAAAMFGFIQSDGRRFDIGIGDMGMLSTPQTSVSVVAQIYHAPGQPYTAPLGSIININWDPSAWNTIHLTRIGSVYSISLNGTALTSYNDTTFNGAGAMALKTYGASNFDNFNLSSVPENGSTIILFGTAFLGLAAIRRRFIS